MSRFLLFTGAAFFIGGFIFFAQEARIVQKNGDALSRALKTIALKDQQISVEIADTSEELIRGLSEREEMEENHGMLFVFSEPKIPSFWMKDMKFSLDIIWINEEKKIVGIERNVSPDTFPQTFLPTQPVMYVLELNAGWTEKHSVTMEDTLTW